MKKKLIEIFPWIGMIKRFLFAIYHHLLPIKVTYAQHGEDRFISTQLIDYNLDSGIYIDIGANHPTVISNSYLFYRKGYKGLIIEPNSELIKLFRIFRPKDIAVEIGCGDEAELKIFYISKTPVLSSFSKESIDSFGMKNNVWSTKYLPILPLDILVNQIQINWVFFMSIDVEGSDYECLIGAKNTLEKTLFLSIEVNNLELETQIVDFLKSINFSFLIKLGCNDIFKNQSESFKVFKGK